ncbi:MAG: hypothetical protein NTX65_00140 [Ignavibacteriales bacterium]|nr:hypothetical protein [Ignavibacteriales bacterium]
MNKYKSSSIFTVSSFLFLFGCSLLILSCESARVEPDLPTPNPPPAALQPLILSGYVKDASSGSTIAAATVKIKKNDGTLLSTILSDNSGKYSYDATSNIDPSLVVVADKEGYGYDSKVADINKVANFAIVADILLSKLQVASAPITAATGGQASTPNTQSVSSQPLTVSVPPSAVSSPVTITAASIPAGQIPIPTTSASAAVQSAGQFGPSGTQFSQPVTISFPLPSTQPVGKTFPLLQLNEQTGTYTNSGFTATVNAGGTTASAQVTHFTIYALSEDAALNLTDGTPTTGLSDYLELASGSATKTFTATNTYLSSGSGTISESWLKDVVASKLSIDFSTTTTVIGGNMPQLPNTPDYQQNGVQANPNVAGKGNWVYRWFVLKQSTNTTGTASGTGWTRNLTIVKEKWINDSSKTGWYWISHDQGGAVSGPF